MEDDGDVTRLNFNAIVSPYMFADTYLPAFQMAVLDVN